MSKIWNFMKRFLGTLGLILVGIALLALAFALIYGAGCVLKFVGDVLISVVTVVFHWFVAHWGVIAIVVLLIAAAGYVAGDAIKALFLERRRARKAEKAEKKKP